MIPISKLNKEERIKELEREGKRRKRFSLRTKLTNQRFLAGNWSSSLAASIPMYREKRLREGAT
jgi:hypothetical protein